MRYETGIACFRNPTDLKRKDKRKRKTKGRQNNETQSVRHSHVPSAENPVFLAYRTPYKDNLSNILICSILAMTRRKAEGELSDESVDLCTTEQREG